MHKPISHLLHSFLLLVLIGTSGSIIYYLKIAPDETAAVPHSRPASLSTPAETFIPTFPATPRPVSSPIGTFQTIPDTLWVKIQPGLERRVITIFDAQNQPVESVHIWRIDQKHFQLDVAFATTPKTLETWQKETNAELVMNGGYFSITNERYSADGLTILNGEASGRSFQGFGGMLAIDKRKAEIRGLVEKPYDPGERLESALQAFPMLVTRGGKLGFGAEKEDQVSARRTVIAQDKAGRILFIVAPQGYFTLHRLSVYLTESDLNLDTALNLDGGGSTGILVADPREVIPSRVLLPFVILVYAR